MGAGYVPGLAGSADFGRVWLGSATVGAGYGFSFSHELAGLPETLGQMPLYNAVHHVHHPCGAFIAEGTLTT